jgi:hypothetical protein
VVELSIDGFPRVSNTGGLPNEDELVQPVELSGATVDPGELNGVQFVTHDPGDCWKLPSGILSKRPGVAPVAGSDAAESLLSEQVPVVDSDAKSRVTESTRHDPDFCPRDIPPTLSVIPGLVSVPLLNCGADSMREIIPVVVGIPSSSRTPPSLTGDCTDIPVIDCTVFFLSRGDAGCDSAFERAAPAPCWCVGELFAEYSCIDTTPGRICWPVISCRPDFKAARVFRVLGIYSRIISRKMSFVIQHPRGV